MSGPDFTVACKEDLKRAVETFGFLPLFRCAVAGYSVEEHADPAVWFAGGEGVWEWKGPVIRETGCAYGKFFCGKAVFISREWFCDFANYRRDGYDFDARFDDGLASFRDKRVYDLASGLCPVLSESLKAALEVKKGDGSGFETTLVRLQKQAYLLIDDFVYATDRRGNRYGWGVARYSTPERYFGEDFSRNVYARKPAASYDRLLAHFHDLLPGTDERILRKLLG